MLLKRHEVASKPYRQSTVTMGGVRIKPAFPFCNLRNNYYINTFLILTQKTNQKMTSGHSFMESIYQSQLKIKGRKQPSPGLFSYQTIVWLSRHLYYLIKTTGLRTTLLWCIYLWFPDFHNNSSNSFASLWLEAFFYLTIIHSLTLSLSSPLPLFPSSHTPEKHSS